MPMSDYLRWLRSRVGRELLLLPSVTVLVRDDAGRILITRNAETGELGFVGGCIEPGESPAEAGVREVNEETGLDVELVELVAAVGGPRFEVEYPNGDRVAYVGVVYDAVVVGGEAHPDGVETVEVTWVEATQLAQLRLNSFGRSLVEELGFPLDPPSRRSFSSS